MNNHICFFSYLVCFTFDAVMYVLVPICTPVSFVLVGVILVESGNLRLDDLAVSFYSE